MNKKWLLPLIGVGALVATVAGGSLVLAQETPTATPGATATPSETPLKKFSGKVAQILGIEQGKVESAMQQAKRELVDEKVAAKLQKLVEAGKLTQAQADEYLAWFKARPEGVEGLLGALKHHGRPHVRHHGPQGHMAPGMMAPNMTGPGMMGPDVQMHDPSLMPGGMQLHVQ